MPPSSKSVFTYKSYYICCLVVVSILFELSARMLAQGQSSRCSQAESLPCCGDRFAPANLHHCWMLRKEGTGGKRAPWSRLFWQMGLTNSPCLRTSRLRKVVLNLTGKAERMGSEMFYSLRHLDDLITRIDDVVVTVGMMVMVM